MKYSILQRSARIWRNAGSLLLACLITGIAQGQQPNNLATSAPCKDKAGEWLKSDRSGFVENKGQINDQNGYANLAVKYLLHMPGLNVQLRSTGFSYDAQVQEKSKKASLRKLPGKDELGEVQEVITKYHRVDIELEGANPNAQMVATDALAAVINVIGEQNFIGIHSYKKVTYQNIYPGIDLEFVAKKGTDKPVEYNFIVHPGADASKIKMHYNSGSDITLKDGKIEMQLAFGVLKEKIPASFTQQDGKSLAVQYIAEDEANNLYAFNVPAYDKRKTLVIDPTPNLVWATYYGGTSGENVTAIDVNSENGNIYFTGMSVGATSGTLIATAGSFQSTNTAGVRTGFVAVFDKNGTRLWSTYFGSTSSSLGQEGRGIRLSGNDLYVCGFVEGAVPGLSTANGNLVGQTAYNGAGDGFLAKFNATTGALVWGTLYGGTSNDWFHDLAIASNGDIYAVGYTFSSAPANAIATNGTTLNGNDVMLAKFNSNGTRLWGTYFGGNGSEDGSPRTNSISLDAADNPYISGGTTSTTGLATGVTEGTTFAGGTHDGFVARFNGVTGAVAWARYYGGAGVENVASIVIDKTSGSLYITGRVTAASTTGISTAGSYQPALAGNEDGFLAKLDLNGIRQWGTYIGTADGNERGGGVTIDKLGNIYTAGYSSTTTGALASSCAYQNTVVASINLYLNKFSPSGSRIWGTYWGVGGESFINRVPLAIDTSFNIYLGGYSFNAGLATAGSHQPLHGGGGNGDGVLGKFRQEYLPTDFTLSANTISPLTQNACVLGIPQVITGTAVAITNADPGYKSQVTYQWQSADAATGQWTDIAGENSKDIQPTASQTTKYYRRLIKVNTSYCNYESVPGSQSAVAEVIIDANIAPVANANGPQWELCSSANSITLTGTVTPVGPTYTYQWFAGNSTTPIVTSPVGNNAVTLTGITAPTTYTLKVTNTTTGCSDIDQTTVTPVIANAGGSKSLCAGTGGVQIGTAPVASPNVTYAWTLSPSGSAAATLSCTDCAQPIANPASATTYLLTVSVTQKSGAVCTTTSTTTVTPVTAPSNNLSFAGADQTICKNSSATLGIANDAAVTSYTWTPGQYLSASNVAQPTFNAGTTALACGQNYVVTAIKNGCTFTDEVKISVINSAITNPGTTAGTAVCGPLWEDGSDDGENCGTATYSWSVVSGTGTILQTRNDGKGAYLNSPSGVTRFRRTTTLNGVSCTSDVYVQPCPGASNCNFNITTTSAQGCPKIFAGGPSFKLTTGLPAAEYNFTWSPAGMVDSIHAAVVTVTSAANTTIYCTITNKYDPSITCTKSIVVNNPSWSLPVFTTQNALKCPADSINIGAPASAGFTYLWTTLSGSSSLNDPTLANPKTGTSSDITYVVAVRETATGCVARDTVAVGVSQVIAVVQPDRTVCNGGTVRLGTPRPAAGTNWTYSWQPSNAAWAAGSSATDVQPQVIFASASQKFTLTVTDPVSGCTAMDTVTLRSTVTAGEFAGPAKSECQGATVQLGMPAADATAVYTWTRSGGTAAPELSCSNCAQPTLTVPAATTTYNVSVAYPGCNTPSTDAVTVTVKAAPAFTLIDRNICPSTATAIGIGASGNTASLANVSTYAWTPATNLSSAAAANPTSNVTTLTTYTLKVTYTNGCTRSDDLVVTPNSTANAKPDVVLCLGESAQIGTPAVGGATYSWSPTTDITSATNIAQPTVKPTTTRTYTVSVTTGGCTATDAVIVTVNTPADFTIGGNTTICEGGTTTLGVTGTIPANTSWQWVPTTGVASPNSPTTTINATDTTTYRLVQTNTVTGCSNYKEAIVIVKPNTIAATVTDAAACSGVATAIPSVTVTPTGTYQYVWSPIAGLSNAYVANPTVTTGVDRNYTVTVTDNTSKCQVVENVAVTILPATACYPAVTLSGNILHDGNGLTNSSVDSSAPGSIPAGIYMTLVDSAGNAVKTVAVLPNGSYDFGTTPPGTYSIVMHQNAGGSTTPNPPAGWMSTGENMGSGRGNDAATNGILTGVTVTATNVTNANFGIQQPPVADPQSYVIAQPSANTTRPLNGTGGANSPGPLSGSDSEDGVKGTGSTFIVTDTSGMNGNELYYNGVLVAPGIPIQNYDPALLSIKFSGLGSTNLVFSYQVVDSAGATSTPTSYGVSWGTALPVHLMAFTATKQTERAALLSWTTTMEQHVDQFVVERSQDGLYWIAIGYAKAAGKNNTMQDYHLNDFKPWNGINYYRLRMNDLKGNYTLSVTRQLTFSKPGNMVSMAPNPSEGRTTLRFAQPLAEAITVKVWNYAGQLVQEIPLKAGMQQYELNLSNEAMGLYLILLEGDGMQEQLKLMLK